MSCLKDLTPLWISVPFSAVAGRRLLKLASDRRQTTKQPCCGSRPATLMCAIGDTRFQ